MLNDFFHDSLLSTNNFVIVFVFFIHIYDKYGSSKCLFILFFIRNDSNEKEKKVKSIKTIRKVKTNV